MSLVVQSLVSANTTAASGSSSTSTGTTAAVPFAQTLVQTMGGNTANPTSVPTDPLLGNLASLLQGLLKEVQTTGEDQGGQDTQNSDLIEKLTADVENLDESINSDPAMLVALQAWLLQVSALLSGGQATEGDAASDAESAGSLSPLAQNADTLRFAVQDDLQSLVTMVQEAAVSGNEEAASKGISLLNNFTAILEQTSANANKGKGKISSLNDSSGVSVQQPVVAESNGNTTDKTIQNLSNNRAGEAAVSKNEVVLTSPLTSGAVQDSEAELTNAPLIKASATGETKQSESAQDSTSGTTIIEGDHEVVTAGQLALRGGITAPLKAEVPVAPVPVHQFAQEMTGFITGKLEIVQKGGVAEATISLFPENLGQVDVKITMQNGHLVAQFMTEHSGAKDMLEQQMNQLRAALQSQGLQVEKLEVTQNNTPLNSQWGQEGRQPGSGSGQQGRRSKERREEANDAILAAELNGEWKDWVSNAGQEDENQGNSFSAKA
ncbi:flagellar hook-length control protein FliK [Paenibacillus sp. G2S3]|uniref:flagellar hook-length control protein FliK n=1 Tax=Paenibacillus sp. G2S3 TaxID=3047872 RepID=UPI0024C1F7CE|nr:flagellar hook-length control protein FliK [Paenibacillus sp. G2S3]WHY17438.1 flagellar hook-length control protein FliK [Paenibacillus sp. G2S3]